MVLRTEAGLDYKVSTTVPQGVTGEIYGIDPMGNWFQVQTEGLDTLAWVLRNMIWVDGLLLSVRRITSQEIATWPALITQPPTLLARSGPGQEYPAVARLPKGTWVRTVGIGPGAEWLQIQIEVEVPGIDAPVWVARRHVKIASGSLTDLPRTVPENSPLSSSTETGKKCSNPAASGTSPGASLAPHAISQLSPIETPPQGPAGVKAGWAFLLSNAHVERNRRVAGSS